MRARPLQNEWPNSTATSRFSPGRISNISKHLQHFLGSAPTGGYGAFHGRRTLGVLPCKCDATEPAAGDVTRGRGTDGATMAMLRNAKGAPDDRIDHAVAPAVEIHRTDIAIRVKTPAGQDAVQIVTQRRLIACEGRGQELHTL